MSVNENLAKLRAEMLLEKIDAYIIPMYDPHLSEYVADHWKTIKWFSGFTGSAANIVVTQDFAGLWTDSRYFIQAEEQLKGSNIEMVKLKTPHAPEFIGWLNEKLPQNSKIAFDGKVFPLALVEKMNASFTRKHFILDSNVDLVNILWENRPSIPQEEIFLHDVKYAGKSRTEKLNDLRDEMKKTEFDYQIISSLDDIAWLFNIRGKDIPFVPLAISYALISQESAVLFIDKQKVTALVESELKKDGIFIKGYNEIFDSIAKIEKGMVVATQFSKTNFALFNAIPMECDIVDYLNITTRQKALKNDVEIKNIKKTMIKDGVAMVKFLYWLDTSIGKEKITEISASEKLRWFRAEQEGFFDESFAPISAYNAHAAMPHYSATPETNVELHPEGIYLIDSGGQYYGGTTDITRTVTLGNPTQTQKDDFTLALKGTIDLAMAVFPYGTKGYQLDALARKPLWDNNMNFGHGTGHGVGFFLNVHEGPQTIGTSASGDVSTILTTGMLTSDEPAFYREGEYGFRTENLILVVKDKETAFGQFLKFETVTLCPIDLKLVNTKLLTQKQIDWLNDYHQLVYKKLSAYFKGEELHWLKENTKEI